jgi:hypothetical protein
MAVKTEIINFLKNELRILRGMRKMAGFTGPLFERRVVNLSSRLELGSIMTVVAKLSSRIGGGKGFWVRRRLMACIAFF